MGAARLKRTAPKARGSVVLYPNRRSEPQHERVVHAALAQRLAALLGMDFRGDFDPTARPPEPVYFVPSDSIVGLDEARRLGIVSEQDLFGGVVPHSFMATKAITHPLVRAKAAAPAGWSAAFGRRVERAVFRGFTVFSLDDARMAARRLFADGPIRIKPVRATAGRGQMVVNDVAELEAALDAQCVDELANCGLVLEEHLERMTTFSVGRVRVGELLASYCGTQRLTVDNQGETVYGGSDLLVVRGDFDALLQLDLPEAARLAVTQAQLYDSAASECFAGLLASRRNYDIGQGVDARGRVRSGVLEQSWRIGGASGAEVAALQAFHGGGQRAVRASTVELYGGRETPPPQADILFDGLDEEVGRITKYITVEAYEHPE
ncbi:DUF3182 family protein [Pseudomonas indica]|uniref:DUF3182 family protein n=1 Tax=Pseudomonas indica TaxID=137658 RepID=UPI000BABE040|nr:DUF3182 family protein [Pseudomonas indica]PAU60925.1 biotin carboxylase [Pseudomonas indica]